jgi:hypothetical protein
VSLKSVYLRRLKGQRFYVPRGLVAPGTSEDRAKAACFVKYSTLYAKASCWLAKAGVAVFALNLSLVNEAIDAVLQREADRRGVWIALLCFHSDIEAARETVDYERLGAEVGFNMCALLDCDERLASVKIGYDVCEAVESCGR